MRAPHVFTVPPGAPFLDVLVGGLLDGKLVQGYSPTRRAARAIRERFLARFDRPVLLPKIRTLGDIDEDEGTDDLDAPELPAVPTIERQLVLTKLVLSWSGALVRA